LAPATTSNSYAILSALFLSVHFFHLPSTLNTLKPLTSEPTNHALSYDTNISLQLLDNCLSLVRTWNCRLRSLVLEISLHWGSSAYRRGLVRVKPLSQSIFGLSPCVPGHMRPLKFKSKGTASLIFACLTLALLSLHTTILSSPHNNGAQTISPRCSVSSPPGPRPNLDYFLRRL